MSAGATCGGVLDELVAAANAKALEDDPKSWGKQTATARGAEKRAREAAAERKWKELDVDQSGTLEACPFDFLSGVFLNPPSIKHDVTVYLRGRRLRSLLSGLGVQRGLASSSVPRCNYKYMH